MYATIHSGHIARWFEELCRIDHKQLREIVSPNHTSLKPKIIPDKGGVYAFWWTGGNKLLKSPGFNRKIGLAGPKGRKVMLEISDEWLGLGANLPIPLYVGKTVSGLKNRVGKHLMLSRERYLPLGKKVYSTKKWNTTCQLRDGIERLFPREKLIRTLILEKVGLSCVILDGDKNAANRFYLEDLAIGLMRPPFNVDIER